MAGRSGVLKKISLYCSKHHVAVGKAAALWNKAKQFLVLFYLAGIKQLFHYNKDGGTTCVTFRSKVGKQSFIWNLKIDSFHAVVKFIPEIP